MMASTFGISEEQQQAVVDCRICQQRWKSFAKSVYDFEQADAEWKEAYQALDFEPGYFGELVQRAYDLFRQDATKSGLNKRYLKIYAMIYGFLQNDYLKNYQDGAYRHLFAIGEALCAVAGIPHEEELTERKLEIHLEGHPNYPDGDYLYDIDAFTITAAPQEAED
ncbi:MAG: hypothetical protein IJN82_07195 [Clostridia bacterium]|nr:hypothetical protein [Clostridia bacterium]MBQ7090889.1 hypothetical protein [Clostridia bacterium]